MQDRTKAIADLKYARLLVRQAKERLIATLTENEQSDAHYNGRNAQIPADVLKALHDD